LNPSDAKSAVAETGNEQVQAKAAPVAAPAAETVTQTLKAEFDPIQVAKIAQENKVLQEKLAKFEAEQAKALEKERKAALEQIAVKDGAAKAIEEQFKQFKEEQAAASQRAEELMRKAQEEATAKWQAEAARAEKIEQIYLAEKKENVIGRALEGKEFVSAAAAAQVRRLLDERFDVTREDSGNVIVKNRADGKSASDVIPQILATDEFEHFLKPATRGGAGVSNNGAGREPANQASASSDDPIESIFKAYKEAMNSKDAAIGFGLGMKQRN
jgi:hypothetical protein